MPGYKSIQRTQLVLEKQKAVFDIDDKEDRGRGEERRREREVREVREVRSRGGERGPQT